MIKQAATLVRYGNEKGEPPSSEPPLNVLKIKKLFQRFFLIQIILFFFVEKTSYQD